MLSYARERLLTQAAAIHPYFPFVRVEVVADIVLFRPRPGMQLGAEPAQPLPATANLRHPAVLEPATDAGAMAAGLAALALCTP